MPRIPSARPLTEAERPQPRSIDESLRAMQAHIDAKKRKANWRKPVDPNAHYKDNGLPSQAAESAAIVTSRYDPHGND